MNRIAGFLLLSTLLFSLAGCGSHMKADMKFSQNRYDEAIPLYTEYLAESPDNANARSRLGFAYLKTNQIDNAISEFTQALNEKPGEPFATLYLGMAYMNNQEFQKAIDTWKGYTDKNQPLVEDEINRLLTILTIAESQKAAQKALAEEKSLQTSRVDPDSIAVGYFQDTSADKSLQAFQKGLAAMIISDLNKIKSLKVVERLRIQALLEEMKLGQTGIVDARTAPRIGKLLGAENMISGSLAKGSISATTSLASSSQGNVRGTSSLTVPEDRFFELSSAIALSSMKILGIELSDAEKKAIGAPQTKNLKAFLHYGAALNALDEGNWEKAKDFFDLALQEDPLFELARKGSGSCPGGSAPNKARLSKMKAPDLATTVAASVDNAATAQVDADAAAAATAAEQGVGTSGGGGSH